MSYDPSDEEFEVLLNDIVKAFDTLPSRTKKLIFVSLFDKISSLKVVLEEDEKKVSDEDLYLALTSRFDRIQVLRLAEATKFLGELMKRELP